MKPGDMPGNSLLLSAPRVGTGTGNLPSGKEGVEEEGGVDGRVSIRGWEARNSGLSLTAGVLRSCRARYSRQLVDRLVRM